MVEKFAENKQIKNLGASTEDIMANGKTIAKMWKEAERMRQVLSANAETQASFEGLYDEDVNFKYKMTRVAFEAMAVGFEAQVKEPVLKALKAAKLEVQDLDSIILHGGVVRTPLVQRALETVVGKVEKLRTNVNSDEAAAFGAAFKGAGISSSFRVKEIRTSEAAIMPISANWDLDGKLREQKLFVETSLSGVEKQFPLKVSKDFSFTFKQQTGDAPGRIDGEEAFLEGQSTNLTTSIKELVEKHGCDAAEISAQINIRLSPIDTLPEVTRGSVSCEVADKKGMVDNVKGLFGFGSKNDQEVLSDEDVETVEASTSEASTTTSSANAKSTKSTSTAAGEKAKALETKKVTVNFGVSMTPSGAPNAKKQLQTIKDRMKAFDKSDKDRKAREEALNTLEGYTYRVRDLLENEAFIAVSTEAQRSDLESKRQAASDWLYGDGSNAKTSEFKKRLREIEGLVDPILGRREESAQRPEQVEILRQTIEQTKNLINGLKDSAAEA